MKLWVAKYKDGYLGLYTKCPTWGISEFSFTEDWVGNLIGVLGRLDFPEVTFENSPQEVELKMCHQTETIKIADCNPKAQPCVLTNHGIDTNVVKFN